MASSGNYEKTGEVAYTWGRLAAKDGLDIGIIVDDKEAIRAIRDDAFDEECLDSKTATGEEIRAFWLAGFDSVSETKLG